jgi:DNA (cytosine-5)-methyltransferase 1
MIGVDLFSGAGGMSLGAISAGIEVALAVEADPHAASTFKANHPTARVFDKDIRQLKEGALPATKRGEKKILFGGPPCQGFSFSNLRTRNVANPNNWLFLEFMRVVRLWKPDWVVFENVKGIINTEGGVFLERVVTGLEFAGYTVEHGVLNSLHFGVPQDRERFFAIGSRHGARVGLPTPPRSAPRHNVADAIGDLPLLANGASVSTLRYGKRQPSTYASKLRGALNECSGHLVSRNAAHVVQRYRHISQGGNWEDIPARLMKTYTDRTRCHTGIYHRLQNRAPSIVIGNFRKNMLVHPTQARGLSVREAARIQSFPDSYRFVGSIGFQQQQVGNAVPPLLAARVFEHVIETEGK